MDDLTLKQATDYVINRIAKEAGISKAKAKKLFTQSLMYTWIIHSIQEQVAFLLEEEEESQD